MPSKDWFRPFYAYVRILFVLFEDGEWHNPHELRTRLRRGDEAGMRGFRQKELEMLLCRTAAKGGPVERRFHAKGWEFRLASIPAAEDLCAPSGVPEAVRDDPRFEALLDSFEAAQQTMVNGGDAEAALRAFNGFFPHETRALRALTKELDQLLRKMAARIETDPDLAQRIAGAKVRMDLKLEPGASPGKRAHVIVRATFDGRSEIARIADELGLTA